MRTLIVLLILTLSLSTVNVNAQDAKDFEVLSMVKYPNISKKFSGIYIFEPGKEPVQLTLQYGDPIAMGTTLNLKMNELYADGWSLVECVGTGDNISEYTFVRKK